MSVEGVYLLLIFGPSSTRGSNLASSLKDVRIGGGNNSDCLKFPLADSAFKILLVLLGVYLNLLLNSALFEESEKLSFNPGIFTLIDRCYCF